LKHQGHTQLHTVLQIHQITQHQIQEQLF
jgi:hypothetical protein